MYDDRIAWYVICPDCGHKIELNSKLYPTVPYTVFCPVDYASIRMTRFTQILVRPKPKRVKSRSDVPKKRPQLRFELRLNPAYVGFAILCAILLVFGDL